MTEDLEDWVPSLFDLVRERGHRLGTGMLRDSPRLGHLPVQRAWASRRVVPTCLAVLLKRRARGAGGGAAVEEVPQGGVEGAETLKGLRVCRREFRISFVRMDLLKMGIHLCFFGLLEYLLGFGSN